MFDRCGHKGKPQSRLDLNGKPPAEDLESRLVSTEQILRSHLFAG